MTAWWVFILGGLGTYLMRASFLGMLGDGAIPGPARRMLKYVAPAAFAAIVLPLVLGEDRLGSLTQTPDARLLAALVALLATMKWRSMPITLLAGMVSLWVLQAIGL